jgi:branched-chain amino acid transport system substrate-binding protein
MFIDDYQAEVMANFAHGSFGAKTAIVLYNENNTSYMQAANVFAQAFTSLGGQITAVESYSSSDDYEDILVKYVDNPPDAIFCPEDYVPAAQLVNLAYEMGFSNTLLLGTDAWDGILIYVYDLETMKNAYYTAPFMFDDTDPLVAKFVREYFDVFSQMPLTGSSAAYSCVYILADAIERAGSIKAADIVEAMRVTDLDTVLGNIKFDENNNPRPNVYIVQIKDGMYSTYKKIYNGGELQ